MGKVHQRRLINETRHKLATQISKATNVLLPETSGYIIPGPGEKTTKVTQTLLSNSVDVTSATKHFDLNLDFGPYELVIFFYKTFHIILLNCFLFCILVSTILSMVVSY